MKIPFSKIIGTKVVSDQSEGVVTLVTGVSIDPENGAVIALKCGFKQILTPIDILKWNQVIHINDAESLTTREDVVRLKNIPNGLDNILYKSVYTEDGSFIGRVFDFTIDTSVMSLFQIAVKKKFLFFTTFETLIQYGNIVEIKEDRIIVKDLHESVGIETVPAITA